MTDFFNDIQYCDRDLTIDIENLKLFIKTNKDYIKTPYIIEDGDFKIAFNAKYLLNVISFTGSNILKARCSLLSAFTVSEDNKSIALILPIKINQ